jgi:hypothetical protein
LVLGPNLVHPLALTLTMELVVVVAHLAHLLSLLGFDLFADVESGSEEAPGATSENARAYANPLCAGRFRKATVFFSRSLSADRLGYAVVLRDIGSPPAGSELRLSPLKRRKRPLGSPSLNVTPRSLR